MKGGYFPVYRNIFDTELVKKPNSYLLYGWLLKEACYKDRETGSFNGKNIEVTYGQAVFGLTHWVRKTGLSEMKLRTSLAYLEKNNFIRRESNNKFSIITIFSLLEYKKYVIDCNNRKNNFYAETAQGIHELTEPLTVKPTASLTDPKHSITNCNNSKNEPIKESGQQACQQTCQQANYQQSNNIIIKNTINTPERHSKNGGVLCPYEKIIALYNNTLSEYLPKATMLSGTRKRLIKARCEEIAKREKVRQAISERGLTTEEAQLLFFAEYFAKIKSIPFLLGKVERHNGQQPFKASFEWILKGDNFLKIIEGYYDR